MARPILRVDVIDKSHDDVPDLVSGGHLCNTRQFVFSLASGHQLHASGSDEVNAFLSVSSPDFVDQVDVYGEQGKLGMMDIKSGVHLKSLLDKFIAEQDALFSIAIDERMAAEEEESRSCLSETEPDSDPSSHDADDAAFALVNTIHSHLPGFLTVASVLPGVGADETLAESVLAFSRQTAKRQRGMHQVLGFMVVEELSPIRGRHGLGSYAMAAAKRQAQIQQNTEKGEDLGDLLHRYVFKEKPFSEKE